MLTVPMFDDKAEFDKVLAYCLRLASRDPAGFMDLYADNLKEHSKPGHAYEATEQTYCQLFGHRRYNDRESFLSAKSKFNNRGKQ